MRKILLAALFIVFSSPSYCQWDFVNPLPDGYSMSCVSFSDSLNGLALGYSMNSRQYVNNQWIVTPPQQAAPYPARLEMISANEGWMIGLYGEIYYFDGTVWQLNYQASEYLKDIDFIDPSNGWAVGDSGIILHYNGINWSVQTSPTFKDLLSVNFINDSLGYIGGVDSYFFKYLNGTFTQIPIPFSAIYDVFDIAYLDTNNIYLSTILGSAPG